MKRFDGLNQLLVDDKQAYDFFTSLSDEEQSSIRQRGDAICSRQELEQFAGKKKNKKG